MRNPTKHLALAALLVAATPLTQAGLTSSFQFNGNGNWSIDGVGTSSTGTISAVVPVGSTIVKAFLYSTLSLNNAAVPSVNFNGTTISGGSWTSLGAANSFLTAYRTDVTAQVAATIGGGSASPFSFSINNENPNGNMDGEVLAIIYSNPGETLRTIAFLDGFSIPAGDVTNINLANPLTAAQLADPNFSAQLSLGIGFGFQPSSPSQVSLVDVNGQRLTSSAGGYDDGQAANGALLTVGGIGDSPNNPSPFAPPISPSNPDDELYSLTPFINAGDTSIQINTRNPTNDDNIFFAAVNITATANVTTGVPDGGATFALLSLALGAVDVLRRRKLS